MTSISIENAFGSLEEWADHYQLENLYRITLDNIPDLFINYGCAEIIKEKNRLEHNPQNIVYLQLEIERRLQETEK